LSARVRVYDVRDQDGVADWMRPEFPGIFYILSKPPPRRRCSVNSFTTFGWWCVTKVLIPCRSASAKVSRIFLGVIVLDRSFT